MSKTRETTLPKNKPTKQKIREPGASKDARRRPAPRSAKHIASG
jgi:hypothetical protein